MACLGVVGITIPKSIPPRSWKSEPTAPAGVTRRRSTLKAAKANSSLSGLGGGESSEGGMKIKYEGTRRREKELTEMIQKKIREAEEVCGQDKSSDGCKVAWDEVEEISEAKANLKLHLLHSGDPLENFCQQHPETDECRIYHD